MFMLPNYLILTPDGVGSTYLQRTLNVHLNSLGLDYWNTHELMNGLAVLIKDKSIKLHKNNALNIGYNQTVSEICDYLSMTNNNLVSRIAQYHIINRKDDCTELYNLCKTKFDRVIFCSRNPFEYALSWSIRQQSNTANVYSIPEKKQVHENIERKLSENFFQKKLNGYKNYEYWAYDNFKITDVVNYEDMHKDPNGVMEKLTGQLPVFDFLQYNVTRYNGSKKVIPSKQSVINTYKIHNFTNELIKHHKMPNGIPIKMNTLQDKQNMITNFDRLQDRYNSWAKDTNTHSPLTKEDIEQSKRVESEIYAT